MRTKNIYFTIFGLVICLLVSPVILLKVGPAGYDFYGPDVPDVHIFGATIFGKDKAWWGINFAYKFQLSMILVYLLSSVWAYIRHQKKQSNIYLIGFNIVLLLLFPLWLYCYVSGVVNNSDGADLTIYPHLGIFIYVVLLCLNGNLLYLSYKQSKLK